MLNRFIVCICFLLLGYNSNATHLIGGNLGYEYIGPVVIGGVTKYRYKIILTTYTNCGPDANPAFQIEPESGPLYVGIYEHDVAGVPLGGVDKNLVDTIGLVRVDTTKITPELPTSCTVGASTCIFEAIYEGFINLDLNFTGYHVFYDRCCRNGSIVNLATPGAEGLAFDAYIGPPLVGNSSPVFTDVPIPFLCVGDTTSILNTAVDPDGDQLVYSFVDPYAGFSSAGAPAPLPPDPTLGWTIPTVTWGGGYSPTVPFGAGGYSFIDGATGLTAYYSPNIGDYVVAVEITEYNASGNIVGITRRDLQLLVLNCPPNPAPNIDPTAGTTLNSFTVVEGETLCFDFGFDDPNNDSVVLTVNGDIFDASITNPPATIDTPAIGLDTVSAQFCWTTGCGQAQTLPYQFSASVTDNGCPPKTTNEVYLITVVPYPAPDTLFGPIVICQNDTATYTTQLITDATYNWTITGGTVIGSSGNQATILWTSPGTGNVSVTATSLAGCESLPIDLDVTVISSPSVDAGGDQFICNGDSVQLGGSPTGPIGASYQWAPNTNIDDNTLSNPSVYPSSSTDYIVIVSVGGVCDGRDTVTVTVGTVSMDAGQDSTICFGDSLQLQATGGVTYSWTPSTGLSDPTIPDPIAQPDSTTVYYVDIADASACSGVDSVIVTVTPLPTISISNDTTICEGDCAQLLATGGGSYDWSPALSLSDPTITNPVACITNNETFQVIVNSLGCEDSASVNVTVNPAPIAVAGNDTSVCENDCAVLNGSGGIGYDWSPAGSLSDPTLAGPTACPSTSVDYELTVTDINGCTDTDSVRITVNALPNVDAGSDIDLCTGSDTTLNASGAVSYSWSPITDLSDPSIFNPVASPTSTTVYTVTGTDVNNCSDTNSIVITVNALPTITVSNDTTICSGDTAQLAATGGTVYNWTPPIGLSDPNVSNPVSSAGVTSNYTVHVIDGAGCEDSASVLITVNDLPIIFAGNDEELCQNDTIGLSAAGGITYNWFPTDSLSDPSIGNPLAWPLDSTQYVVSGTDVNGCSNTDTLEVNVIPLPNVDAGDDLWVCPGDSVQITATGTGTFNWSPSVGLSNTAINNPMASPSDTTQYVVTLTDLSACVNSDTVNLFVNAAVPSEAGPDSTICAGDTIQIGGNPSSIAGSFYSWTPVVGLSDPTVSNPLAFPTVTTTYFLNTTNDTCSGIDSVTIFVNTLPLADAGTDSQICIGDTLQLLASGGSDYQWIITDSLSDPNVADPFAWPLDTTVYIVQVTDTNGCSTLDSVQLTINPLPSANAGNDTTICLGDTLQLEGSGGDLYAWTPAISLSDSSIFNPLAFPTSTTIYTVSITDSNLCIADDTVQISISIPAPVDAGNDTSICFADSVQLSASGSATYTWSPIDSLSDPTIADPIAYPFDTLVYYVTGTDAIGCSSIDSVVISINPLPAIQAGNDSAICIGDTIQLNGTGGINYTWTPSSSLSDPSISNPLAFPVDTTEYIILATDTNACTNTDTITIHVNGLPDADAGPDLSICNGDTIQLNAAGGSVYQWSPSTLLDNPNVFNPNAFPDTTTDFIVLVTDTNSCSAFDTMEISIFILSVTPQDTTICSGDSVQLNVNGPNVTSYLWTPPTGLSDPTISSPMAAPTTTTVYTVVLDDVSGCSDSASATINVQESPIPSFSTAIDAGCEGIIVDFENTSTLADSYLWLFGDGTSTTIENPSHTYDYGSSFTATLIAYGALGCSDSASFSGTADNFEDYYSIQIPNVFTPNGDGQNDQFVVSVAGKLYECIDMRIYNRWGQILFIASGNNLTWDGRNMAGEKVPQGSYFYTINIKDFEYNGHLTIFE